MIGGGEREGASSRVDAQDHGQDVELLGCVLRAEYDLCPGADTDTVKQVLVVPHGGALIADPGWQRFGASAVPRRVGAWWPNADQAQRRIV